MNTFTVLIWQKNIFLNADDNMKMKGTKNYLFSFWGLFKSAQKMQLDILIPWKINVAN
jgi:hypothetical protein